MVPTDESLNAAEDAPPPPASAPQAGLELAAPGEWQIFHLISRMGPATIRELASELYPDRREANRRYTTLLTLAQRLVAKGYLRVTPPSGPTRGRTSAARYAAAIDYKEALAWQLDRFLSQYALQPDDLRYVRNAVTVRLAQADQITEVAAASSDQACRQS
jgi:predicted transcriptional regulator